MHALNKLPYSKLDSKSVGVKEGVVFLTYSSLIASSEKGRSRLHQLVQWCGQSDVLIVFDEVVIFVNFTFFVPLLAGRNTNADDRLTVHASSGESRILARGVMELLSFL